MRTPSLALGAAVLAAVAIALAAAFFSSRDDATVTPSGGPGDARTAPAEPAVRPGNVLLLHREAGPAADLHALADEIAGPSNADLAAAGQAILVRRDTAIDAPITALTSARQLDARRVSDPRLRRFAEYWLGRRTVTP